MQEYIIVFPMAILIIGLTAVVLRDTYLNKRQRQLMLSIIVCIGIIVIQNVVEYILQVSVSMPYIRTVVSIIGYSVRPVIIVLFCLLVKPNCKAKFMWALVTINTLIYLTALFSPFVFYIDEKNHYQGGVLGGIFSSTAYFVSIILLCQLVYLTINEYRQHSSWLWMVIINALTITASMVLEVTAYFDCPIAYVTIAIVCCSLFYYIWLHLEYVKSHEKDLMAEQRIKIMMSQIQPHFLYNTLSTIQSLCRTDPHKAFETTGKFGSYLRNNLESLDSPDLIPLKKELEHTKLYADIEMLRFPKISVIYDIQAESFRLPALTIQPIVENAIRHGVRSREHGYVTVKTTELEHAYQITVSDNGIGFDVSTQDLTVEGSEHIGLKNVKERIETMCSGTFEIESRIDEGTVVTITVPKRIKE